MSEDTTQAEAVEAQPDEDGILADIAEALEQIRIDRARIDEVVVQLLQLQRETIQEQRSFIVRLLDHALAMSPKSADKDVTKGDSK